jgi:hypothetical protein
MILFNTDWKDYSQEAIVKNAVDSERNSLY